MRTGEDDYLEEGDAGLVPDVDDGPPRYGPDPRSAVVRGLRQARGETQLTQVLAAVLGAERGLAAKLVRLVVGASPGKHFARSAPRGTASVARSTNRPRC